MDYEIRSKHLSNADVKTRQETIMKIQDSRELLSTLAPPQRKVHRQTETDKKDEPTWRCHQNPFIGALRIQEPVILKKNKKIFTPIMDQGIL